MGAGEGALVLRPSQPPQGPSGETRIFLSIFLLEGAISSSFFHTLFFHSGVLGLRWSWCGLKLLNIEL
jgi:hypothetical protein